MNDVPRARKYHLPRLTAGKWQYIVSGIVIFVGIAVSVAIYVLLQNKEQERWVRDFERAGQDRIAAAKKTLELDILTLHAVRAFYDGSIDVTRNEFSAFIKPLVKDRLSIHAIEWAPLVTASDREEHFPILFVEPAEHNIAVLGQDLASIADCRSAMNEARDTGKCALTAQIPRSSEHESEDVRAFLPVYRKNVPLDTVEQRRRSLEGFIVGILNPKWIIKEGLANLTPAGVDVKLIDTTDPNSPQVLYHYTSRTRTPESGGDSASQFALSLQESFQVAGREWTVACTAAPSFIARHATWHPWIISIGVFMLSGFSGLYLIGIAKSNSKTARLAQQLTVTNRQLEKEIADRKRMEEKLHEAKEAAEAATRAKSRFLASMSHEIRTPMTSILGYADLLMDSETSAGTRNNYLATIRRSGEHLLALINDILDLSKIEAGKMTVETARCNVISLLADVASVVRPRAESRGVAFSVEYPEIIPETILTDGARLRQAIINLAGNAVKFTEKGSVRIAVSMVEQDDLCGGRPAMRFQVTDTGIGIREEVLPELFRPFVQGDASVTQKFGGTGLGLAISRHIANLLGGELAAASAWGEGSTFTLTVPAGSLQGVRMLQNPAEVEQQVHGQPRHKTAESLQGVRILLAEDGPDNRRLIQTVLSRAGAMVETAENGRLALDRAKQETFDLILMDTGMPVMDGYEAASALREWGYRGPIMALTANAMTEDRERCRLAGCDEYFTKPIDRASLVQTIAKLCEVENKADGHSQPVRGKNSQITPQTSHLMPHA